MTLSTPAELQARFDALTARIVALDREIVLEVDRERRAVAQAKRDELAHEREGIAAELKLQGVTLQQPGHLEHRVTVLEKEVDWIKRLVKPGARQLIAKVIFFSLLVAAWSMWMVKEIRDWFLLHPLQAILITLALGTAALIIRWLPEDDHDQR